MCDRLRWRGRVKAVSHATRVEKQHSQPPRHRPLYHPLGHPCHPKESVSHSSWPGQPATASPPRRIRRDFEASHPSNKAKYDRKDFRCLACGIPHSPLWGMGEGLSQKPANHSPQKVGQQCRPAALLGLLGGQKVAAVHVHSKQPSAEWTASRSCRYLCADARAQLHSQWGSLLTLRCTCV